MRGRNSRVAFAAWALALASTSVYGHIVDPKTLTILGIGKTATFSVRDQGDCLATISAAVTDSEIVEVTPTQSVPIVSQIFTVKALKAGTTTIRVSWLGAKQPRENCDEDNRASPEIVTVTVRKDVDLTIEKQIWVGFGRLEEGEALRLGSEIGFVLVLRNIGHDPSDGPITVLDTLAPGFRYTPGLEQSICAAAGQTVRCDFANVVSPGRFVLFSINVTSILEGLFSNSADIFGGGDVNLLNNSSNIAVIEILSERASVRFQYHMPANVRGRVRR